MFKPITSSKLSLLGLVLTGLLLSGCINAQTNIALYGNEQWNGTQAIQVSAEFAEMLEQGDTVTTEGNMTTTTSVETDGLNDWLKQAQQAANRGDVNATLKEYKGDDGSLNYVMQAGGQSYKLLNELYFEGNANITVAEVNGQRQITIKHLFQDPSADPNTPQQELSPEEIEMQSQMLQAIGLGISFRISGGQIISSNATRVEGNTAIWETPGEIEITLTEAAEFDPATITLVAPPQDSGFSAQALETIMSDLAKEMEAGLDSTTMTTTAEENGNATTESAPQKDPDSTQTSTESTTQEQTSTPDPGPESADAVQTVENTTDTSDNTTPQTEVSPATPTESDTNLPQSGAVLPDKTSIIQLVFAGLVLTILGGTAAVNVWKQRP